MKFVKYTSDHKSEWNKFAADAKNSHFFFQRDYMDYHSDRFDDFSLLVYDEKEKLTALLPANINNNTVISHQGLTFGGFLVSSIMRTEVMLNIFQDLLLFLKQSEITKLVYNCIPYIYHQKPCEEDRYALFINNAKLTRRDVSSTIDLTHVSRYSKGRKWSIAYAKKSGVQVIESHDYKKYWELLTDVLQRNYGASPVHSCDEIVKLSELFPDNIKLFTAVKDDELLAGIVIFENKSIVHVQYSANSIRGRSMHALDLLIDHLITSVYCSKRYFDFGTSNENNGRSLNHSLIFQKEHFGASAVVHDFYELDIV